MNELLTPERLFELGPGQPNVAMEPTLRRLSIESLLGPEPIADRVCAEACLAGLWLYHDFLDESHEISQRLSSSEGSYWHAIMHRREPDASNSKYWFRRIGSHPVVAQLAEKVPLL